MEKASWGSMISLELWKWIGICYMKKKEEPVRGKGENIIYKGLVARQTERPVLPGGKDMS